MGSVLVFYCDLAIALRYCASLDLLHLSLPKNTTLPVHLFFVGECLLDCQDLSLCFYVLLARKEKYYREVFLSYCKFCLLLKICSCVDVSVRSFLKLPPEQSNRL